MAASFCSLIFLFLSLIHATHAEPRDNLISDTCSKQNVSNGSLYFESYTMITSEMKSDMARNKFAFNEAGKPPNKLHVFSQCMEDLSDIECVACFEQISTQVSKCFPATGARVYSDGCYIRVENYSFFQESTSPEDKALCGYNTNLKGRFEDAVRSVISAIVEMAPSSEGFAEYNENSFGFSVYGMANCWKTLDADMCAGCLEDAANRSFKCLPSTEARVVMAGCFLRYADYEFGNSSKMLAVREATLMYTSYVIGVVVACTLAIMIGFFAGKFTYNRKNRRSRSYEVEMDLTASDRDFQFLQFKYSILEKATENFNAARKLGQGGYSEVFKGTLPDGREIAIKRLVTNGKSQSEEVYNEMDIIRRAQHKNLVHFLGCCFTNVDNFLVYEYLANKSLDLILFDPEKKKELDWKKRLGIIIGTAEGLQYLHKDCQVRIIHRDIKASNILLDLKYRPKIADFGLARFHSRDKGPINTAIAGTLGYMAPEYLAQGRLTEKVDIYSFGVLMLELVSGVQNNKYQPQESLETLVTTAWKHFQLNTISEIIDESMETEDVEEVKRVAQVGLLCTQESPSLRPTMQMVLKMLRQKDVELPMPSKPPFMELSSSLGSNRQLPSSVPDLSIPQTIDIELT